MNSLTDEQIKKWEERIDEMNQEEMCRLWRFAPVGHVVFNTSLPLAERFDKKFRALGGMTPEISKKIGW